MGVQVRQRKRRWRVVDPVSNSKTLPDATDLVPRRDGNNGSDGQLRLDEQRGLRPTRRPGTLSSNVRRARTSLERLAAREAHPKSVSRIDAGLCQMSPLQEGECPRGLLPRSSTGSEAIRRSRGLQECCKFLSCLVSKSFLFRRMP